MLLRPQSERFFFFDEWPFLFDLSAKRTATTEVKIRDRQDIQDLWVSMNLDQQEKTREPAAISRKMVIRFFDSASRCLEWCMKTCSSFRCDGMRQNAGSNQQRVAQVG